MMENIGYISEEELYQREEDCRKALKTVTRAMLMRVFVAVVLIWSTIRSGMPMWAVIMMAVVLVMNLLTLMPLWQEWVKRRKELKEILEKME